MAAVDPSRQSLEAASMRRVLLRAIARLLLVMMMAAGIAGCAPCDRQRGLATTFCLDT